MQVHSPPQFGPPVLRASAAAPGSAQRSRLCAQLVDEWPGPLSVEVGGFWPTYCTHILGCGIYSTLLLSHVPNGNCCLFRIDADDFSSAMLTCVLLGTHCAVQKNTCIYIYIHRESIGHGDVQPELKAMDLLQVAGFHRPPALERGASPPFMGHGETRRSWQRLESL